MCALRKKRVVIMVLFFFSWILVENGAKKSPLFRLSFSLQFAPPNKPWRRDKLKNSFVFVSIYKCEWLLKKFIKKTSEISVILISSKKYAKNIFNFQLTTQNATKDPDELPDDWPQRVQELLLQQLLLYYNHHREILSCFLEITTMKMNIRPVIFLPPECIIVQPLMTTHKNVWDLFCWNTL